MLLLFVTASSPAHAADERLPAVRAARAEVQRITDEVKAARPYANGQPWMRHLRDQAARLDREGGRQPGRFRWFTAALPAFETANQETALRILAGLDQRLALVEENLLPPEDQRGEATQLSKQQIKALLPPEGEERRARPAQEPPRQKPPEQDHETQRSSRRPRQGPGAVEPNCDADLGSLGWIVMGGLLVGVVVVAFVLAWRRKPTVAAKKPDARPADPLSIEALLQPGQRNSVESLWRRADELARAGRHLEAVRALYLAVLALLHRADFIRVAPTRSNGEYHFQLRDRPMVGRPFRGLTGLFEVKWYGERACQAADYDTCRRLADEVRKQAATNQSR